MNKTYRKTLAAVKPRIFFCRMLINGKRVPIYATLHSIALLFESCKGGK
jgi:hypothetical protein